MYGSASVRGRGAYAYRMQRRVAAFMSTDTAVSEKAPVEKFRKDYKPLPFKVCRGVVAHEACTLPFLHTAPVPCVEVVVAVCGVSVHMNVCVCACVWHGTG